MYQRERRARMSKLRDELLGTKCFFCGGDKCLQSHRKDGEPHKTDTLYFNPDTLKQEEFAEDFVRLCMHCHRGVHWCMKWLGYTWDNLLSHVKS